MNNNKGIKIADKYFLKAQKEKEKTGYRENLGYEYYDLVKSEIDKLELSYYEKSEILSYFVSRCDRL